MIGGITAVVVEVVGGGRGAGRAGLGWTAVAEDGHLVSHNGAHVGTEGLHILTGEDLVLLGLIPVGLEMSSEV